MFDSIYPADLPRRQIRGLENGYKSWWCSHRCDREVPVWCGCRSLILAGELQRNGESVAAGVFVDSGFENGVFYGALHKGFVYMPASFLTCQFVFPAVFLRKEPLPFEFLAAWRIFWVKGIGKAYGSESFVQILLVNFSDFLNLFFQVLLDRLYVFDSGRFSWNLFLNCDTGFAFYFERELYFFLTRKTVFSKKTALSCIFF